MPFSCELPAAITLYFYAYVIATISLITLRCFLIAATFLFFAALFHAAALPMLRYYARHAATMPLLWLVTPLRYIR